MAHISSEALEIKASPMITVYRGMSFLGSLTACILAVPWTQWHTRRFKFGLLSQWHCGSLHQKINIPLFIVKNLQWWCRRDNQDRGKPINPRGWTTITSDASLRVWGAHCQGSNTQGKWPNQVPCSSNLLAPGKLWRHFFPSFKAIESGSWWTTRLRSFMWGGKGEQGAYTFSR